MPLSLTSESEASEGQQVGSLLQREKESAGKVIEGKDSRMLPEVNDLPINASKVPKNELTRHEAEIPRVPIKLDDEGASGDERVKVEIVDIFQDKFVLGGVLLLAYMYFK